ncbi:hypothetical protein ACH5RR_029506 [Cinchona calisaya]|uniref:Reverse transcriptase domain-containing protein n=1 Tax=Cinchona calisaya TaxID=153742 RepID=A0ABD2YVD3_9GENT
MVSQVYSMFVVRISLKMIFLKQFEIFFLQGRVFLKLFEFTLEEQSGFVTGRTAADSVLLAQEVFPFLHKKVRGHNVAIKLDMMKAFDEVSLQFISLFLLNLAF